MVRSEETSFWYYSEMELHSLVSRGIPDEAGHRHGALGPADPGLACGGQARVSAVRAAYGGHGRQ